MTDYEKYQLQWMIDHNHSLNDLLSELTQLQYEDSEDSARISTPINQLFDEWLHDAGFGSKIWACEKEWKTHEKPVPKSTGIIRRIDDLGRIVIPKNVRAAMNIQEGMPWEIIPDGQSITLRPYTPVSFEETVIVPPDVFERVNKLLSRKRKRTSGWKVQSDQSTHANIFVREGIYRVTFHDGSYINYNLWSDQNYCWEEITWHNADDSEVIALQPKRQLEDIEVDIHCNTYIVKVQSK